MKNKISILSAIILAILFFCLSLTAQTTPRKSASPSVSPTVSASAGGAAFSSAKATRPLPFHGMISAVDKDAKTFTITSKKTSRVFKVTDKTLITKGSAGATIRDITANQEASGSYWKYSDGTLEAKNIKLGPMAKPKSPPPSPTLSPKFTTPPKQ
ncbi:MAG TPA: hypothetical protein VFO30_06270 [Chthoniobacterales bacterium]|nr:hypothetical protein [Chthoniobacterales bacterium]